MKILFITLLIISVVIVSIITLDSVFALILNPRVISISPDNESQNVLLDSSLIIKFDKPIKRQEIQHSILPEIHGEWQFRDSLIKNHLFKTLVFVPTFGFDPETEYQVRLENIQGFVPKETNPFSFNFQTISLVKEDLSDGQTQSELELKSVKAEEKVTILDIPLDWQDYSLSCEAASLKMALGKKGIFISEDKIMSKIGYDLTSRRENVWGDPYQVYVGDISGKMCQTGYGVYWGPVAKAAQSFSSAEAFSNWGIEDLVREIDLGNPVIVWGSLAIERLTDCSWYTQEGKYVKAFKETHVRLAIGFVGPVENPSKIILNDPLYGRTYWAVPFFLKNWETFDYSGVVVR
ncbi:MAG: C39 family peptidase [Patescibacteria group bacterium]|nr:C39 family peptidase [Patescibacteria group bacterium]